MFVTTTNLVVANFGGEWTPEQALLAVLAGKEDLESVAIIYRYKTGQTGSIVSSQSSAELHFKGALLSERALRI